MIEIAALGAALCWAVSGVMGAGAARAVGPFNFAFYRQVLVTVLLVLVTLATGGWRSVGWDAALLLALSGFIGIFIGDTVLYVSLVRLGPRRTGALFALNAPMAALLGWLWLDEALSAQAWVGVALCALGVTVSVLGRPGRSGGHAFEAVHGPAWLGIALGLASALAQACASLIARPVMAAGTVDAMTATLIRVAVAALLLALVRGTKLGGTRPWGRLTRKISLQIAGAAVIGMVIGGSLLLFALGGGKVGIVSTLSALSPIGILPVMWLVTGSRPSVTSWAGALIAVVGMAAIFLR